MRPLALLALLLAPAAPPPVGASAASSRHALHLLLTTDEHGWLEPLKDNKAKVARGGVVNLYDTLRAEGYPGAGFVLLSDGDMWTGPYESTVREGAPMVAAMSRMGYAAAAVGNHEFDFGVRALDQRAKASKFPFLAANLVERATGKIPSWAKPFVVLDVDGVKLGVVGLACIESPETTDPKNLTGLDFLQYAASLDRWIPKARAAGAEEIVVLVHESMSAEQALMPTLRKHHVRAVAFGHHHVQGTDIDDNGTADVDDDVVACNAGAYMRSFCRIDLELEGRTLVSRKVEIKQVTRPLGEAPPPVADHPPAGDPRLSAIVADAERSAEKMGGEVLVENAALLERGPDGPLGQLVVDAWRSALPYAQVAVTNAGGLRQDLPAGPVRVRDVVSVLPFNNTLLVVDSHGQATARDPLAAVLRRERRALHVQRRRRSPRRDVPGGRDRQSGGRRRAAQGHHQRLHVPWRRRLSLPGVAHRARGDRHRLARAGAARAAPDGEGQEEAGGQGR